MKPYFDRGGIRIYHGDYRDVEVEILPVGMIPRDRHVLVADPPYGLGDKWDGGTWADDPMYSEAKKWDVRVPDADLLALVGRAGQSIVWGGNYYALPPSRCWLAWVKSDKMETMADLELAWTSLDQPAKYWASHRRAVGPRSHPTQKPLGLMTWCLGLLGEGLVFDPFMGSGTTLRAAKDCGRLAVGCDLSEKYCEIAARRLDQEVLFA